MFSSPQPVKPTINPSIQKPDDNERKVNQYKVNSPCSIQEALQARFSSGGNAILRKTNYNRSPGGTPVRTRSQTSGLDLVEGLRRKFASMNLPHDETDSSDSDDSNDDMATAPTAPTSPLLIHGSKKIDGHGKKKIANLVDFWGTKLSRHRAEE
jgi:hypothetical protein